MTDSNLILLNQYLQENLVAATAANQQQLSPQKVAVTTHMKPKPEMKICNRCRENGLLMQIMVQPYLDPVTNTIKNMLWKYNNMTRHWHLPEGGQDFN